jgi:hypothetical protein
VLPSNFNRLLILMMVLSMAITLLLLASKENLLGASEVMDIAAIYQQRDSGHADEGPAICWHTIGTVYPPMREQRQSCCMSLVQEDVL